MNGGFHGEHPQAGGQDGQVRYQCQVRRDGFQTVSRTLLSLKEAKAWITAIEHAQNVGEISRVEKPKDITLHDALERYLTEVSPDKKGGVKERARIRVMLGSIFLTEPPLHKVTPGDIARYIRERQKEVKPITVHREVAILSHLFTVARREWQLVRSNPVADTRRPKVGKGRDRHLHPDEEARLRLALRKSGDRFRRGRVPRPLAAARPRGHAGTEVHHPTTPLKRVVEKHGGWVRLDGEKEGATVSLWLPAHGRPEAHGAPCAAREDGEPIVR